MTRRMTTSRGSLLAAALLASALAAPTALWANGDGRQVRRFTAGCGATGSCHLANTGATATLMGPTTMRPNERATFTLVITSTRTDFASGGLDVAAVGPTGTQLATNPGQTSTRVNQGELVQSASIPKSGDNVTVRFDLFAPPTAGMVTLNALGNAVDGRRNAAGDAWARATHQITIEGEPTDGGPRPVADSGVVPTDVGLLRADVGPEGYDPGFSSDYGGYGCSTQAARGSGWAGALGGLAVLALLAACTRRR